MSEIENFLLPIVKKVNEYLSDYILIVLLIGVGLYFSIRTRFVQIRCFGEGMKRTFGGLSLKGEKALVFGFLVNLFIGQLLQLFQIL